MGKASPSRSCLLLGRRADHLFAKIEVWSGLRVVSGCPKCLQAQRRTERRRVLGSVRSPHPSPLSPPPPNSPPPRNEHEQSKPIRSGHCLADTVWRCLFLPGPLLGQAPRGTGSRQRIVKAPRELFNNTNRDLVLVGDPSRREQIRGPMKMASLS